MATVTATLRKVYVQGDRKKVIADITLTGSYLANGEALAGSLIGLELELNDVETSPAVVTGGVLQTSWDATNGKIKLYGAVDATPAANEASPELAAGAIPGGPAVLRVQATGKGSAAA